MHCDCDNPLKLINSEKSTIRFFDLRLYEMILLINTINLSIILLRRDTMIKELKNRGFGIVQKRESDYVSHSLYLTYLLQLNLIKSKKLMRQCVIIGGYMNIQVQSLNISTNF